MIDEWEGQAWLARLMGPRITWGGPSTSGSPGLSAVRNVRMVKDEPSSRRVWRMSVGVGNGRPQRPGTGPGSGKPAVEYRPRPFLEV